MAMMPGSVDPLLHQDIYTDLLTFTFCGPAPYNQYQPIFIDAEDPSRAITAAQFRQLVRTLIAGFKAHNVQKGDCVLLHLGNSVSSSLSQFQTEESRLMGIRGCRSSTRPSSSASSAPAVSTWDRTPAVTRKNWTISSASPSPR